MKTIMTVAKALAESDQSKKINVSVGIEHFKEALHYVRVVSDPLTFMCEYLGISADIFEDNRSIKFMNQKQYNNAVESRMKPTDELADLIETLAFNGYSVYTDEIAVLHYKADAEEFFSIFFSKINTLRAACSNLDSLTISTELPSLQLHNFNREYELLEYSSEENSYDFESIIDVKMKLDDVEEIAQCLGFTKSREIKGFDYLDEINTLRDTLKERVVDQDSAVDVVCNALVKSRQTIQENQPKAILTFMGPSATGKSFFAKQLQLLLKEFNSSKVIDMTQYSHDSSASDLFGTSTVWANARVGQLTSFVKENPQSIIIFDEFEKAHSAVQASLLSILSEGKATDACGWNPDGSPMSRSSDHRSKQSQNDLSEAINEVDFSQTIVVFTSSLGKEIYGNTKYLQTIKGDTVLLEKMLFDAISREMKYERGAHVNAALPELVSRLKQGNIALFDSLTFAGLEKITSKALHKDMKQFQKHYDVHVELSDIAINKALVLHAGPDFDVRNIDSNSATLLLDAVTKSYRKTAKRFESVSFRLSDEAKTFLDTIEDYEMLMKELKRKNQRLHVKIGTSFVDNHMVVVLSDFKYLKVPKSKDYKENGGLSIDIPNISFKDVVGHEGVKKRLKQIMSMIQDSNKFDDIGVEIPKGMLLYGAPGSGKTMLAKALAHEAELPFIATTGDELLQKEQMKNIFSLAREYAPSIIFIDEIDSIRSRGSSGSNNSFFDTKINELLAHIDGFLTDFSEPVFIIAATNNKDGIDPAILRSGRIDLHIEVPHLSKKTRAHFIAKMINNEPFNPCIDDEKIIKLTAGLSGADLKKIERESLMAFLSSDKPWIQEEDVIEQINILRYGQVIKHKNIVNEIERTAYHEAGHAVLSHLLVPEKKIEQISVAARANSLGSVTYAHEELAYVNISKKQIKHEMIVLLAGRIAEEYKFDKGSKNNGAVSDLRKTAELAYSAITELGMSDKFENISFSFMQLNKGNSYYLDEIEHEVVAWISEANSACKKYIQDHWDKIDAVAKRLIEETRLDDADIVEVFEKEIS